MSNFSDFFPAPGGGGGGGGGIPKYQEFITSGTFTPTQALIDAGGRITVFVVGGGGGSANITTGKAASGGEVLMEYMTLTNTNAITVTIGSGGNAGGGAGANTDFSGSNAGGIDISALGGITSGVNSTTPNQQNNRLSIGYGAIAAAGKEVIAGSGTFGYGAGGATAYSTGVNTPKANSGQAGGYNSKPGASGFVRVTWFE